MILVTGWAGFIALAGWALLQDQALAISVTSYNGMLYFGINADREAMADVDLLPALLNQSLEELLEASR